MNMHTKGQSQPGDSDQTPVDVWCKMQIEIKGMTAFKSQKNSSLSEVCVEGEVISGNTKLFSVQTMKTHNKRSIKLGNHQN